MQQANIGVINELKVKNYFSCLKVSFAQTTDEIQKHLKILIFVISLEIQ
jgi:hypothetical protein